MSKSPHSHTLCALCSRHAQHYYAGRQYCTHHYTQIISQVITPEGAPRPLSEKTSPDYMVRTGSPKNPMDALSGRDSGVSVPEKECDVCQAGVPETECLACSHALCPECAPNLRDLKCPTCRADLAGPRITPGVIQAIQSNMGVDLMKSKQSADTFANIVAALEVLGYPESEAQRYYDMSLEERDQALVALNKQVQDRGLADVLQRQIRAHQQYAIYGRIPAGGSGQEALIRRIMEIVNGQIRAQVEATEAEAEYRRLEAEHAQRHAADPNLDDLYGALTDYQKTVFARNYEDLAHSELNEDEKRQFALIEAQSAPMEVPRRTPRSSASSASRIVSPRPSPTDIRRMAPGLSPQFQARVDSPTPGQQFGQVFDGVSSTPTFVFSAPLSGAPPSPRAQLPIPGLPLPPPPSPRAQLPIPGLPLPPPPSPRAQLPIPGLPGSRISRPALPIPSLSPTPRPPSPPRAILPIPSLASGIPRTPLRAQPAAGIPRTPLRAQPGSTPGLPIPGLPSGIPRSPTGRVLPIPSIGLPIPPPPSGAPTIPKIPVVRASGIPKVPTRTRTSTSSSSSFKAALPTGTVAVLPSSPPRIPVVPPKKSP